MGMQCYFSYYDVTHNSALIVQATYNDDGTWICQLDDKTEHIVVNLICQDAEDFCWFDIGTGTPEQMRMLAFLIRNRICFSCS